MPPIPSAPAATAFILAHLVSCPAHAPATFHLEFLPTDPAFYGDSKENMTQRSAGTNSMLRERFPITSGVTEGSIGMSVGLQLATATDTNSGEMCLWPKDIELKITYKADVYIAQDYPQGSCRYNETMQHELRHVQADADTLAEFMPRIESQLAAEAGSLGESGPVEGGDAESVQNNMMAHVEQMAQAQIDTLDSVRGQRQQAIDTPAEYERLSRACPEPP
jgi:hypothetical protein